MIRGWAPFDKPLDKLGAIPKRTSTNFVRTHCLICRERAKRVEGLRANARPTPPSCSDVVCLGADPAQGVMNVAPTIRNRLVI